MGLLSSGGSYLYTSLESACQRVHTRMVLTSESVHKHMKHHQGPARTPQHPCSPPRACPSPLQRSGLIHTLAAGSAFLQLPLLLLLRASSSAFSASSFSFSFSSSSPGRLSSQGATCSHLHQQGKSCFAPRVLSRLLSAHQLAAPAEACGRRSQR